VHLVVNGGALRISTDPTLAGQASADVTIPAGSTVSNTYYLQALGSSGQVTYTSTAHGFAADTGTVNLMQSGVLFLGPSGQISFNAPIAGGPVMLTASLWELDPSQPFGLGSNQQLAGGVSLTLSLSDNATIGTITSPTINGGDFQASPVFTPKSPGSTTITLTNPPGFVPTAFNAVTANVN
jgi:hypothetical protein